MSSQASIPLESITGIAAPDKKRLITSRSFLQQKTSTDQALKSLLATQEKEAGAHVHIKIKKGKNDLSKVNSSS